MFPTTSLNCLVPIETVEDSDYSEVMSFLSPLAVILQGKLINSFNKYDIQWSRQTGRISALKGSFGVSDFCQFGQFFPSDSNFPSGKLIEQSYCLCKGQHWNSVTSARLILIGASICNILTVVNFYFFGWNFSV